jgi:DNA polymerase III subunit epsilon
MELHQEADHHRALSDAITALELLKKSLKKLPKKILTVEDLIRFSKEAPRLRKVKKEEEKIEKKKA